MIDRLSKIANKSRAQYTELRYQSREMNVILIEKGELESANSSVIEGVGIRTLVDGAWGFSSTNDLSKDGLITCLDNSFKAGKMASKGRREKIESLGEADFGRGSFRPKVNDPVENHSLEEKMKLVRQIEKQARDHSKDVKGATCRYYEILDKKTIVTSDGIETEMVDVKPEFMISVVAGRNREMNTGFEAVCVTGGWKDLFSKKTAEDMCEKAASRAVRLLDASNPKGGPSTVILDSGLVGLICHEAIGHTVEGDLVLAGSITKGKLGQTVASPLVNLVDSGRTPLDEHAAGTMFVDEEGVRTCDARVIERGVLNTYLVNRELAPILGVKPCGNARAYIHTNRPLVRMRNTFIEPGDASVDEMVEETKKGFLLKGAGGGQADANAEFMFTVEEAYEIENGETGKLLKNVTISGKAFDVLQTVDMVGKEFKFDMGNGFCFKGQPAKVDGGGPDIRCTALVGGSSGGQ